MKKYEQDKCGWIDVETKLDRIRLGVEGEERQSNNGRMAVVAAKMPLCQMLPKFNEILEAENNFF